MGIGRASTCLPVPVAALGLIGGCGLSIVIPAIISRTGPSLGVPAQGEAAARVPAFARKTVEAKLTSQ